MQPQRESDANVPELVIASLQRQTSPRSYFNGCLLLRGGKSPFTGVRIGPFENPFALAGLRSDNGIMRANVPHVENPAQVDPPQPRPAGALQRRVQQLERPWQEELKDSWPGMALSFVAHLLFLSILALIVYQVPNPEVMQVTDLLWGPQADEDAELDFRNFKISSDLNPETSDDALPAEEMLEITQPSLEPAMLPSLTPKPVVVTQKLSTGSVFAGRSVSEQAARMVESGGSPEAAKSIRYALEWIARQQQTDGHWEFHQGYPNASQNERSNTGATGLALLTFLGAGSTHTSGPYEREVRKGIAWLIENQQRNGNFYLNDGSRIAQVYSHSIALIAVCECYAMTRDDSLRAACENGVRFLEIAQENGDGGWRYDILQPGMEGDLSVTGWALMALQTAKVSGIDVPKTMFRRAIGFLNSVEGPKAWQYRYVPGRQPTLAMSAEGLVCREWLGMERTDPALKKGVELFLSNVNIPKWEAGKRNLYAWYYIAHATHNYGGERWEKWYGHTQKLLMSHQITYPLENYPGDVVGSWHPHVPAGDSLEHGDRWGRLYITCLCTLILETPFRHLPLYEVE